MLSQKVSGKKHFYYRVEKVNELDTSEWEKAYFVSNRSFLIGIFQDSTANVYLTSYITDSPFTVNNSILIGTGYNIIEPGGDDSESIFAINNSDGKHYRLRFEVNEVGEVSVLEDWIMIDIEDKTLIFNTVCWLPSWQTGEFLLLLDSTGFLYFAIYNCVTKTFVTNPTILVNEPTYGCSMNNSFLIYGIRGGDNFNYYILWIDTGSGEIYDTKFLGSFSNEQIPLSCGSTFYERFIIFKDSITRTFSFTAFSWVSGLPGGGSAIVLKTPLTPLDSFYENLMVTRLWNIIFFGTNRNEYLTYQICNNDYIFKTNVRNTGIPCDFTIRPICGGDSYAIGGGKPYCYININQKMLAFDEIYEFTIVEENTYNNIMIHATYEDPVFGPIILMDYQDPVLLPNGNIFITSIHYDDNTYEHGFLNYTIVDQEANVITNGFLGEVWTLDPETGIGGSFDYWGLGDPFKFQRVINGKVYSNQLDNTYNDLTFFVTKGDIRTYRTTIGIDGTTILDWEVIPELDGLNAYSQIRLSENNYAFVLVDPTDPDHKSQYYVVIDKWGNFIKEKTRIGNGFGHNCVTLSLIPSGFVIASGLHMIDGTSECQIDFCDFTGNILKSILLDDRGNSDQPSTIVNAVNNFILIHCDIYEWQFLSYPFVNQYAYKLDFNGNLLGTIHNPLSSNSSWQGFVDKTGLLYGVDSNVELVNPNTLETLETYRYTNDLWNFYVGRGGINIGDKIWFYYGNMDIEDPFWPSVNMAKVISFSRNPD